MSNPFNGSRRGQRGGSTFRPSRKPLYIPETTDKSSFALVAEAGIGNSNYERVNDDLYDLPETSALGHKGVRFTSVTEREHLQIFPQDVELERLKDSVRLQPAKGNLKVKETTLTVEVRKPFRSKDDPGGVESVTLKGKVVKTTNPRYRVSYKSDKTLLRNTQPDRLDRITFKRVTSHSKRKVTERREVPADKVEVAPIIIEE